MSRITPVRWQVLECIFIKAGFSLDRHKGTSHRLYTKIGVPRPITIPTYREVQLDIIQSNMRTAGMTRDDYFKYLDECK